jgi:hypothetical protein
MLIANLQASSMGKNFPAGSICMPEISRETETEGRPVKQLLVQYCRTCPMFGE